MPSLFDITKNVEARIERMPVQYGEPASVEYVGPEQVPVALECAYCGKVIVVDLLRWNGECFRCSGSTTIDEIATALSLIPAPVIQSTEPPWAGFYPTGTMAAYTDPIMMPSPATVPPPKPPMLGYYKGIPMDEANRERIEKESGEIMEWLAAKADFSLDY